MLETTVIDGGSGLLSDADIQIMKEKLLIGIQLQFSAKPILVRLAEMLDEAICLAVPSGEQLLVVDMVLSSLPHEIASLVGRRYPRSFAPEESGFAEVVTTDFLPAGGSAAGEQRSNRCRMIKVPLWNGQQRVCGWLCLLGSAERLPPKRLRDLLPVLRAEGESLSISLRKRWFEGVHIPRRGG